MNQPYGGAPPPQRLANGTVLPSPMSGGSPFMGGVQGGAQTLANMYSAMGANAQNQQAAQIAAPSGGDPAALAHQQAALAALHAQASGAMPSASAISQSAALNQGLGAAFAAQHSGSLQSGMQLGAGASGAIAQGGAGRLGEIGAAQQQLGQGLNAASGLAVNQANQDQRITLQQMQLAQQQQAAANAAQLGYQNLATGVGVQQLKSDTDYANAERGAASSVNINNIGNAQQMQSAMTGAGFQAAGAGLGTLANAYGSSGDQSGAVNANTGMTDQEENNY